MVSIEETKDKNSFIINFENDNNGYTIVGKDQVLKAILKPSPKDKLTAQTKTKKAKEPKGNSWEYGAPHLNPRMNKQ